LCVVVVDDKPTEYHVKAVLHHVGQCARSGHYVASVRRDTHWLLCDDDKVRLLCTQQWKKYERT